MPRDFHEDLLTPGIIDRNDPPPVLSGMASVVLDGRGRLEFLEVVPPQLAEAGTQSHAVDWNQLFAAAQLDPAQFQPATPVWNSLAASDTRAAWTGKWPATDQPLRIEAAAFQGKPVFFSLIGPWTVPHRMHRDQPKPGQQAYNLLLLAMVISVALGAALLARRNYMQGRGDRRGAFRLAYVVFVLLVILWLLRAHFVPSWALFLPLVLTISTALFCSGLIWIMYLSLEPYVRRHWPQTLISWSRLLMGQIRDPLVGRDLLLGVILGVIWLLIFQVHTLLTMRMGASPNLLSTEYLSGTRMALGMWLRNVPGSIEGTLLFFFLLFILRVLLRKEWLAGIVFVAIWVTLKTLGSDYPLIDAVSWTLLYAVAAIIVFRVGFVALAVAIYTADLLLNVPMTLDFSTWYAANTLFPLLSVVALAGWGFYTSLAGQKLWNTDAFQ